MVPTLCDATLGMGLLGPVPTLLLLALGIAWIVILVTKQPVERLWIRLTAVGLLAAATSMALGFDGTSGGTFGSMVAQPLADSSTLVNWFLVPAIVMAFALATDWFFFRLILRFRAARALGDEAVRGHVGNYTVVGGFSHDTARSKFNDAAAAGATAVAEPVEEAQQAEAPRTWEPLPDEPPVRMVEANALADEVPPPAMEVAALAEPTEPAEPIVPVSEALELPAPATAPKMPREDETIAGTAEDETLPWYMRRRTRAEKTEAPPESVTPMVSRRTPLPETPRSEAPAYEAEVETEREPEPPPQARQVWSWRDHVVETLPPESETPEARTPEAPVQEVVVPETVAPAPPIVELPVVEHTVVEPPAEDTPKELIEAEPDAPAELAEAPPSVPELVAESEPLPAALPVAAVEIEVATAFDTLFGAEQSKPAEPEAAEVEAVVEESPAPQPAPEPTLERNDVDGASWLNDDDRLYVKAGDLVLDAEKASISFLQRQLGVGYFQAAKLLDRLEKERVIGPYTGSVNRALLCGKPEWTEKRARVIGN